MHKCIGLSAAANEYSLLRSELVKQFASCFDERAGILLKPFTSLKDSASTLAQPSHHDPCLPNLNLLLSVAELEGKDFENKTLDPWDGAAAYARDKRRQVALGELLAEKWGPKGELEPTSCLFVCLRVF